MESVTSYYKEEPYFPPSDKYLEPQVWLNCDEQQRMLHYHYNKRGLSYANRSTPLQDLSRLPHTPEQDYRPTKNGINTEIYYGNGTYSFPSTQVPREWTYRAEPNGVHRVDVHYNENSHVSPKRSKSKERSRKLSSHYEYSSPVFYKDPEMLDCDAILLDGGRQNVGHKRHITTDVIKGPPTSTIQTDYYYDVYRDGSRFPHPNNTGMWHPWSDVSRPLLDRSSAMSPSSPLDSGLSSQSVASTPNSDLEPLSNWDQTSNGNGDWFQKSYPENHNMKHCSCPSAICPIPQHSTPQHNSNSRRNPHRAFQHPSSQSCQNNCHFSSTKGMRQRDVISSFDGMTPGKNIEMQCKCYSSVESISDSYELRNGSWTLHQENRDHSKSNNPCNIDNGHLDSHFDRTSSHHRSFTSDETSESTLKDFSSNITSSECKSSDETGATYKANDEHLRHKSDSEQLPSKDAELLYQKQRVKNAKKTEKALCELEEIYSQLNLDDFDLLDRAERRDLPTAHQLMGEDSRKSKPLTRSNSDTFYEIYGRAYGIGYSKGPRAPPLRRAGIPDRVADDMALRKQQKPPVTKFGKPVCGPSSYLLYSSHFTPSIPPVVKDFPFANKPDVEYDDLSYRKYFQPKAYHELPQPPFGIPVHPVVQCPKSNYLYATPSSIPRALCHARGNPDLVRDDMAFRNLRKDNPNS